MADPAGATVSAVAEVIARGQLHPVYQPIVAIPDGRVIGVEGLIRPMPPAPFANPSQPVRRSRGRRSGHEARPRLRGHDRGRRTGPAATDQFLTVNLAPSTLEASEFSTGAILAILARHEFSPDRLIVELTEHQPLRDLERARSRMAAFRRAGIRVAADDIGAGNAGLRLLSEIEFDILKVDLTLVQRSESERPSNAVIGSVVELAARTGALVIAEGIERSAQIGPLLRLGITAGQGFYLGRPGAARAGDGAGDHPDDDADRGHQRRRRLAPVDRAADQLSAARSAARPDPPPRRRPRARRRARSR